MVNFVPWAHVHKGLDGAKMEHVKIPALSLGKETNGHKDLPF